MYYMYFLSPLPGRLMEMNELLHSALSHQPTAGLAGRAQVATPPSVAAGGVITGQPFRLV